MDPRIVAIIFRRLLRKNKIGASHTDADHLIRGVRGDLRGQAKDVLERLIKEGYLIAKKTPYGSGLHVSINPQRLEEIAKLLGAETAP